MAKNLEINLGDLGTGAVPKQKINLGGKFTEVTNSNEFYAIELIASKKTLEQFVTNQLGIEGEVNFLPKTIMEFQNYLGQYVNGAFLMNNIEHNEIAKLTRVYYPSKDATQSIQGLFDISINRSVIYDPKVDKASNLFEESNIEDPEVLFESSAVDKFSLEGVRKIYYTTNDKIHYLIPALTVVLSYFGFVPSEAVKSFNITLAETADSIAIKIRK